MSSKQEKEFNFCIARYWNGKDGSLCIYSYGSQVHYGTQKSAQKLLDYVLSQNPEQQDYKIFKIDA